MFQKNNIGKDLQEILRKQATLYPNEKFIKITFINIS